MAMTKNKKRAYQKEYMKKRRSNTLSLNNTKGLTNGGSNTKLVFSDDSSILDIESLERNREKLTMLCNFLKDSKFKKYMKDIRYGIWGCALDRVDGILAVIK